MRNAPHSGEALSNTYSMGRIQNVGHFYYSRIISFRISTQRSRPKREESRHTS